MRVSIHALTAIATAILLHAGRNQTAAERVSSRLVSANVTGHDSHGVGMIPAYVDGIRSGQLLPNAEIEIVNDKGPFLLIDGGRGFGHVIAEQAMEVAIERAKASHFSVLSLRNSFHLGRLGDWGEMAARSGFICIIYANVQSERPLVAPHGGSDARFVTNPYCTSIPATEKHPTFILDIATSTIAMGKARVANLSGKQVPEGSVIDQQGNPTTDPSVMFQEPAGSLIPFGQHKGFGLALLGDILGGAFSGGGAYLPEREVPDRIINNMMAILIDPNVFGEAKEFGIDVDKYIDWVKASPPAPGFDAVLMPGDPERLCAMERRNNGIPLDAGTIQQLIATARSVNVPEEIITMLSSNP